MAFLALRVYESLLLWDLVMLLFIGTAVDANRRGQYLKSATLGAISWLVILGPYGPVWTIAAERPLYTLLAAAVSVALWLYLLWDIFLADGGENGLKYWVHFLGLLGVSYFQS